MMLLHIFLLYTPSIVVHTLETARFLSSDGLKIDARPPFIITSLIAGLYESQSLFCTGIMVSDKHLLTAATCLKNFLDNSNIDFMNYHAKLGYLSLRQSNHEYHFKEVKVHEDYNHTNKHLDDNIGIITLEISNIKPELLRWSETSRKSLEGVQFRFLIGWGNLTNTRNDISKLLMYVRVRLITSNTKRVLSQLPKGFDHHKMVGTFLHESKTVHDVLIAEKHDIGAPVLDIEGKVTGILSSLPRPEDCRKIAIFVKLQYYTDWIEKAKLDDDSLDCERSFKRAKPDDIFKGVSFHQLIQ